MPQSLSNVLIHLVFSTKNRETFLKPELAAEMHPYLAALFRVRESPTAALNGANGHIQDEYSMFLKKYGLKWDERYVWD
jgi:hypothetical protein